MEIDGYASEFPDYLPIDDLLVDGWRGYSTNPFVAAHLLAQDLDKETVFGTLDLSEEDVQGAYSRLNANDAWPVFRLPLGSGNNLTCVYRNFEGDEGIDYLLESDGSYPYTRLTSTDHAGPGISWPELYKVTYGMTIPEQQPPARQLLFFLPMMSDAAAGEEAVDITAEALSSIGGSNSSRRLAIALIDRISSHWGRPHWTLIDDDCMVCDARYSPRNPNSRVALDRGTLVRVSRALNPR